MDPFLPYRRTGRTTQMLTHALALAQKGERVIVWAATDRHADQLAKMVYTMIDRIPRDVCRNNGAFGWAIGSGHLSIIALNRHRDDVWEERTGDVRLRGESHDTRYLMDHHTLEVLYPRVIEQWLEFDL